MEKVIGLVAAVAIVGAIATGNEGRVASADVSSAPAQPSAPATMADCSDAQAAGIVGALNDAELAAAHDALSHGKDPRVIAFAKQMIDDHTKLGEQLTDSLRAANVSASPTDIAASITKESAASVESLRASKEYDRDFAAAQIIAHAKGLGFAQVLHAQSPQLRTALENVTQAIQKHLELAFQLEHDVAHACGREMP